MAIKTTYTEDEVKAYMETVLGETAHKLNWAVEYDSFDEPTNQVLYTLGESNFSFVSSVVTAAKLRSVARLEAWRAAMYYTAHEASHSVGAPGTGSTSRGEVYRHCKEQYDLAYREFTGLFPEENTIPSRDVLMSSVAYVGDYA